MKTERERELAILATRNEKSRLEDAIEIIVLKAKLKIEKAHSSWLDNLADDIRDGEDREETEDLYSEYKALRIRTQAKLMEDFGIEL
jgi:transcriptional accessory protein Tex/SPT6